MSYDRTYKQNDKQKLLIYKYIDICILLVWECELELKILNMVLS